MPRECTGPSTDKLHRGCSCCVRALVEQLMPSSGCQETFLFLPGWPVQTTLTQCIFLFGVHSLKLFLDFYHHLADQPCHHLVEHHLPGVAAKDMGMLLCSLPPGIAAENRYELAQYLSTKNTYLKKNLLTHLTRRTYDRRTKKRCYMQNVFYCQLRRPTVKPSMLVSAKKMQSIYSSLAGLL